MPIATWEAHHFNTTPGMPAPSGYTTKIFGDTFPGTTLNAANWQTYMQSEGSRWTNGGLLPLPWSGPNTGNITCQVYNPSQVAVSNGLTLTAQTYAGTYNPPYPWISGCLTTGGLFQLPTTSAWYVQARIKMPDTSLGMWPALWFLRGTAGSPDNEIDGWEGGFNELPSVPSNRTAHYDFFADQGQQASEIDVGFDVSLGYHVYGVEFVPATAIRWFLDGAQMFQVLASGGITIAAEPYEIILSHQVTTAGSGFHTNYSGATPTTYMLVAEVQAWTP